MIVADTSVWADHFRGTDSTLVALLDQKLIYMHEAIRGEIALGNLQDRTATLKDLALMPHLSPVSAARTMELIERVRLMATGLGWVDALVLASVHAAAGVRLWTRDKRLNEAAQSLNLGFAPR